ncbi:hypothetical protein ASF98_19650 [Arthrobacter sp. Leaf337]|uniref:DUF4862 family protein n=1 Tax=Arthrobacter sp. Leaf337 TaxID=1736342 RepID=UPI0006F29584|nr:DUF4862 family protein [Arthrobacter sp. Leaf337]KQR80153.1 hypothetical protein ASF98_19650 [Arthrobacter sp. Leaf337]
MNSSPGLILSAYAAAPAIDSWHPSDEAAYLSAVGALPYVAGLEIPFYGSVGGSASGSGGLPGGALHKYDGGWLLRAVRHLPQHLAFTVTTIPDTMDRLGREPAFGLASKDTGGRQAALAAVFRTAEAVRSLNDAVGRQAVRAVHLFSAPRPSAGVSAASASAGALRASLAELAGYAWDGARPVLEHCDAALGNKPWIKGFLPLEAEIEAITAADAGVGLAVNWARSVIEQQDVSAPSRHLKLATDAGVLAGVVLSGCSPVDTAFGRAWDDTHLPPAPLEPRSLLTADRIREFTVTAGAGMSNGLGPSRPYRGLKVSAPRSANVEQRIAVVSGSIAAVCEAGF